MDRWQETIAENLATSPVPGFKRQEYVFSSVLTSPGLRPGQKLGPGQPQLVVPRGQMVTSFQPGALRPTQVKTDFAIEGPGFFEVRLPNGTSAYTRDGEFRLSPQGQLMTKDGHLVQGDGGPIQLDPTNPGVLTVSRTGEVSQGGEQKGRLKLVEISEPQLLTRIAGGYFLANDPKIVPEAARNSTVRQGYLEMANTSAVVEMGTLMGVLRTFEANQRVAQIHDERLGRAIHDLTPTV